MVKGYLISLILTALWVATQILVFHLMTTRQLFKTFTILYLLTLPAYLGVYVLSPPDFGFLPGPLTQTPPLLGLLNGLVFHLLLYFTYLACFYYVDRPLTLRILIAFLKSPEGKLTLREMKAAYGLRYMILRRLEAMKDGGFVVEREGKYFLTPLGKKQGKLLDLFRKIVRVDRTQKGSAFKE